MRIPSALPLYVYLQAEGSIRLVAKLNSRLLDLQDMAKLQ